MGGPQESPEKTMGSSPEVVKWAKAVLGEREPGGRLVEIPMQEGVLVRVVRGTDVAGLTKTDRRDLLTIADEAAWIDQLNRERLPQVQSTHFEYAEAHPGVRGIKRDEDHGNYKVTAVPQLKADVDDDTVKASLTPEERARVYSTRETLTFVIDGDLLTTDGIRYSPKKTAQIIRGLLQGMNVEEGFLDEKRLAVKVVEERDNTELATIIVGGREVHGVRPILWRQEVDAVDKHRATEVRRPRRKNLITPRRKPKTESAS